MTCNLAVSLLLFVALCRLGFLFDRDAVRSVVCDCTDFAKQIFNALQSSANYFKCKSFLFKNCLLLSCFVKRDEIRTYFCMCA